MSSVMRAQWLRLLQQGCHVDFTIVAGNRRWLVHKLVLLVRCPALGACFQYATAEQAQGTVQLDDFDADIVGRFIAYLYGAEYKSAECADHEPRAVTAEELHALEAKRAATDVDLQLWTMGNKYLMEDLQEDALQAMIETLSNTNLVPRLEAVARATTVAQLSGPVFCDSKRFHPFIRQHWNDLVAQNRLDQLSAPVLLELLVAVAPPKPHVEPEAPMSVSVPSSAEEEIKHCDVKKRKR